ncbi:MAG: hypothetical protein IT249_08880 [Chitinophagaceae bacterium]|nr:hypothetical protein [Chitinophagaceae bacterium]
MKRQAVFLSMFLFSMACKKENSIDPLQALTEKNRAALINTEWYGLYRNKGEETYGNISGYRGYAIAFGTDSAFTFYSAGFTLKGYWSVNGDTTRFRFATGAQNKWAAVLQGDSLFTKVTQPLPDNFLFDRAFKKIPDPPADVIGHIWKENTMSANPYQLVFSETAAGVGYPRPVPIDYNRPPVKNKIFNTTNKINFSFLIIVDGKTAWTFDETAYNFQYNY